MSITTKSPREIELEALLAEWKQYVKETKFNNDVLKEEVIKLREYCTQLHGLKEVLRAEVSRLDGDWPAAERRYAELRAQATTGK